MASNNIGKDFVITSFGESHGICVGTIVDGCPAGLPLSEGDLQKELDRRIPQKPEIVSARREKDQVEILSGVFEGKTTGAPICSLVWNRDVVSDEYHRIKDKPRPGHADYPARIKYGGFNDYRGGGRFSGRITVSSVIAGAIAKKLLNLVDVQISAYTFQIGEVKNKGDLTWNQIRKNTYQTDVRSPDLERAKEMQKEILEAKKEGDSIGGIVECTAVNLPVGIGEPIFDSLDADIAKMLFDVPAVKGVEIGTGFKTAQLRGSENNDPYALKEKKVITLTNHAGGVLGGISTGMPLIVRAAIKPTPSISKEQKTVNLSKMEETNLKIKGRHDPCIVPKAVPVIESAVAIVLADHMLRAGFIPKVMQEE
ncbi:MAG: chorismate synthase [Thermoproteota archaeon]